MKSESYVPKLLDDEKLRGQFVVLESIDRNMNTIKELGGSIQNHDPIMVSHIAVSHSAALREDTLRTILQRDQFRDDAQYWAAVETFDENVKQPEQ